MKFLLEQERRSVAELMEQVSVLQTEVSTLKEDYQNKEEALKRENEVLRDQLKKYVSLVQAQRKETITKQTSSEGSVCVCVCLYSVVGCCTLIITKTYYRTGSYQVASFFSTISYYRQSHRVFTKLVSVAMAIIL